MAEQISYSQEIARKGIHLAALLIPLIYSFIEEHSTALWIILPMTAIFVLLDTIRNYSPWLANLAVSVFGKMMRPHELDSKKFILNGASYVFISASLCILLLPKILAITAFSVLIIADTASALYGRRFGKTPFFDKSLEGSSAFVVSAFLTISTIGMMYSMPFIFYLSGLGAAIIGAVAEAASVSLKLDDNFSVPISVGGVMWISLELFGSGGV